MASWRMRCAWLRRALGPTSEHPAESTEEALEQGEAAAYSARARKKSRLSTSAWRRRWRSPAAVPSSRRVAGHAASLRGVASGEAPGRIDGRESRRDLRDEPLDAGEGRLSALEAERGAGRSRPRPGELGPRLGNGLLR